MVSGERSTSSPSGPGLGPPAPPISLWQQLVDFLRMGRPLHLIGGFVLHGLGIAIAHSQGAVVDWSLALWAQLAITSSQLMTHYSNEYFDLDADRAAVTVTRWASGSRVLPEERLSPRVALVAALALCGIALFSAAVVALRSTAGLQTLMLLLLAVFLAWSYSSPPLYLNRRGWGELTGAVLVPGLTTLVGYQVQAGQLTLLPFLAALPLSCFQFAMLLAVNFPDAAGDRQAGKRTLVVRLGGAQAARLFAAVIALGYLSLPLLVWLGLPLLAALAVQLTLPLGAWQAWRVSRGAWDTRASWNSLGFWSIGLLMSAAGLELVAFALL